MGHNLAIHRPLGYTRWPKYPYLQHTCSQRLAWTQHEANLWWVMGGCLRGLLPIIWRVIECWHLSKKACCQGTYRRGSKDCVWQICCLSSQSSAAGGYWERCLGGEDCNADVCWVCCSECSALLTHLWHSSSQKWLMAFHAAANNEFWNARAQAAADIPNRKKHTLDIVIKRRMNHREWLIGGTGNGLDYR